MDDFATAMLCVSAAYAVVRCLSVSPDWLFVMFVYCIKTNKRVLKLFSPSDSRTILVFPSQTLKQYSDGNPTNGSIECR